jgi:hypothetical protein
MAVNLKARESGKQLFTLCSRLQQQVYFFRASCHHPQLKAQNKISPGHKLRADHVYHDSGEVGQHYAQAEDLAQQTLVTKPDSTLRGDPVFLTSKAAYAQRLLQELELGYQK